MYSKASGEPLQLTNNSRAVCRETNAKLKPLVFWGMSDGFSFENELSTWHNRSSSMIEYEFIISTHEFLHSRPWHIYPKTWLLTEPLSFSSHSFRFEMRHLRQCVLWEEDGIYIRPTTTFSTERMTQTPSASLNDCTICVTKKKKKKIKNKTSSDFEAKLHHQNSKRIQTVTDVRKSHCVRSKIALKIKHLIPVWVRTASVRRHDR